MTIRGLGVAGVFLVGCAVGGMSSQLQVPKASAQQASLTRWEVTCIQRGDHDKLTADATALGAEGWEITGASGSNVWCFKRPKM